MSDEIRKKRKSLIMAGGGIKVAFQAGVLQVWLDEAGLEFDHVDGASGGVFNLAMYCQGLSGTQIADNWRSFDPLGAINPNWKEYFKLFWGVSFLKYDRFRKNILTKWGLDWEKIRASDREATFNIYNFSKHELVVVPARDMSEDLLIAGVSLPLWFPPVEIAGDQYIDAVYVTDANIEDAIDRGADEIWVIWTVSRKSVWRGGLIATYFQIIEAAANGPYNLAVKRINRNNARIAAGQEGEFGRHIELKVLAAEVPLHYLFNFSKKKVARAVDLGAREARDWCQENGIALDGRGADQPAEEKGSTALSFTETMKGFVSDGDNGYETGSLAGRKAGNNLAVTLTIKTEDVARFLSQPAHLGAATGTIWGDAVGGEVAVEKGYFNLFIDAGDGRTKLMRYLLHFSRDGEKLTLSGFKKVRDDPGFDVWTDTTTLFTRLLKGHVEPGAEDEAQVVAAGIIRIHPTDFLKQLTTFRVKGPNRVAEAREFIAFVKFFLGALWDVYGRHASSRAGDQ